MNDLFVSDAARGTNVGHALIEAAARAAKDRGHARMSWQTAVDNRRAQRLYERFDGERTIWFEYEIRV
jgi:GNAT superfamily N-acetyltransferase